MTYIHLGLYFKKISISLLIFFIISCSVVPKSEFTDYQRVFTQVRQISEDVIIDYAVAKKEQEQLKQRENIQDARKSSFNSKQLLLSNIAVDDIVIRLQAWKIIDAYNKLLTKLIAGEEIEAVKNNLFNHLLSLSVNGLRSAAANLSPSVAALNAILIEVQKAFERHKIIKSIEKISPIIRSKLIATMKIDSELFYRIRYGINNYHYQIIRTNISRHIGVFIKLANSIDSSQDNDVYALVDTLNERLEQISVSATGRGFKLINLTPRSAKTRDILAIPQLKVLEIQILMLLAQAEQQNLILEAYGDMLTAYVRLLGQMDLRLRLMQQAAINGGSGSINLDKDFEIALIKMQQAFLYYQKTQE